MDRASNDATLSEMGDIYKHYVALLECFKMHENETVLIEVCGDVSKLSKKDSFQMEVKHHAGNKNVSDRDIDLWKTLRNWIKEFNRIKDLDRLILFTTADIQKKSLLYDWNQKNIDEKLNILRSIGSEKKKKETTFRGLYDEIFLQNHSETDLKCILSKFEIQSKRKQISNINSDFNYHIRHIPKENREKYIAALLGIVQSEVAKEPYIWEITYELFESILQDTNPKFAKADTAPLPTEYISQNPPTDVEDKCVDKIFINEIRKIDYYKVIPIAIKDYWRTYMTILKYYKDNPIVNQSLSLYRGELVNKLSNNKDELIIDYQTAERSTQIKESQKLYSRAMGWDVLPIEKVSYNQSFFQKGMMHIIVEDKAFTWDVGDDK